MDEQTKTELMIETLSEGLNKSDGRPRRIVRLERSPYLESTSFPAERIKAHLDSGDRLDIFFKDLHSENLLDEARSLRAAGMERSEREFRMYRDVLSRLPLSTPELYGSRWTPEAGICWIFLEDAGPFPLRQIGDFSCWLKAARWAARLHAVDPADIMEYAPALPEYDAEHYRFCAERAARNRSAFKEEHQALLDEALDRFHAARKTLAALPKHLIHGEFFGKNIVIRPEQDETAVAVTDWESAAFGPRCVDLVSLTSGKWSDERRAEMINAYIDQSERETGGVIDRTSFSAEFETVALYRALWWVGYWSESKGAAINGWVKELKNVLTRPAG
jgi:hypothetical protein